MDPLRHIEPADLDRLVALEPERALGLIVELNGRRYHNRLNVVEVLVYVRELREALGLGRLNDTQRRVA